jgi:hypothetical protein
MFSRKEKPLPVAVLKPSEKIQAGDDSVSHGIPLGQSVYWTPERLPNGHIVAIDSSGSGKTQTLKAITYELHRTYPAMQLVIIDFHGDHNLRGEVCYPLHMSSPYGVNPLYINSDLTPFSTSHFLDEKARLEARETAQNPVTDIGARSESTWIQRVEGQIFRRSLSLKPIPLGRIMPGPVCHSTKNRRRFRN